MCLVRDKRIKDAYMNDTIQKMFDRGELRKDHPLQRKPDQWTKTDKDGLIASVIKGEDIDSIKLCEQLRDGGVVLWLIDGVQRVSTLNEYKNGVFKVGSNIEFPIIVYQKTIRDSDGNITKDKYGEYKYENVEYDLRGKGYSDLPPELKEKFDNFKIDIVKHLDCTDEEIGYHIRRYNKQKSMNMSQSAVTYMDNMAKEVKRISLHNRFFKDCGTYSAKERNNGTIERIIIESVMCMFHFDKWNKQSKKMGAFLNKNSSKKEFDKLEQNLVKLEKIVGEDEELQKLFTSKDSFIWFTVYDKFTALELAEERFLEFLYAFKNGKLFGTENGKKFLEINGSRSTKDKSVVSQKLALLEELLHEFFHIKKEDTEDINELEFIQEVVDKGVTKDDLEQYEEVFEVLTLNVDNTSKLLHKRNHPSLIAMVAYSFDKEIDLDDWIVDYFKRTNMYSFDQKQNFLHMKADLDKFMNNETRESA